MRTPRGKSLLLAIIAMLLILCYRSDMMQFLTLDYLTGKRALLEEYNRLHPCKTAISFFLLCILLTGLSLPVAAMLMIAGGVIFGLLWGTIIVSFASAAGSTLAFLSSRYLLRDIVQQRFSGQLEKINREIEVDGVLYLLLLRQVAVFPSFLINILMGLTPISVAGFYVASQIGMLAITVILVNAGTHIAAIQSSSDVLSFPLIFSLMLAGTFPLLAKKAILRIKTHRTLAKDI